MDVPALISRTGYTGEDGFEVYAASDKAEKLWNKFLDVGIMSSCRCTALWISCKKHFAVGISHGALWP